MQTPQPGQPDDMPESPVSLLGAGAAQAHEMFLAYIESGFTPGQALHLVSTIIVEMMRQAGGGS